MSELIAVAAVVPVLFQENTATHLAGTRSIFDTGIGAETDMPQVWRVKIFGSVCGTDDRGCTISLGFGIYEMREVSPRLYQLTRTGVPPVHLTASALGEYIGLRMSVIEGAWP